MKRVFDGLFGLVLLAFGAVFIAAHEAVKEMTDRERRKV